MSDQPTAPAPSQEPQEDTQEPAAAAPENQPPWGDDFDPERAWKLVQDLRADKARMSNRTALSSGDKAKLAEYDRLVEASKSDLERAQEATQQAHERAQGLLSRAVKSEVKALAASQFADPEDAAAFLDLSKYTDTDGDVDTRAIQGDLADLLSRKPHLGKPPESRVPAPNPAQGSSASGARTDEDTEYERYFPSTPIRK